MEKKQKIVKHSDFIQGNEKKPVHKKEKEKTVPKRDGLQKDIEKDNRNHSRKRKSESKDKSVSSKKKRTDKKHSQNSSNDRTLPTIITSIAKKEANYKLHNNGFSNSNLKHKKTRKIRKSIPYERKSDNIEDSTLQEDDWLSTLDQLARNGYIPDEKITQKRVKKTETSSNNKVVVKKNLVKLEKVLVIDTNGVNASSVDNEDVTCSVLPATSPIHTNSYDPNLSYDACDIPPPTNNSTHHNGGENNQTSPTFTDSFESVNKLGQSMCSEDDDDDDDLPEFVTNTDEHVYTPNNGDLIWLKYRKSPFWPAKILRASKLKPNRIRLKVYFFGEEKNYSVNYTKSSILPYFHPNKDAFIEKGKEIENERLKELFLKGIRDVTSEVMKKASVSLNSTPTEKLRFELNSSGEEHLNGITPTKDSQSEYKLKWKRKGRLSLDSKITNKMLDQCKKRKARLKEKNKILVEFIKTDKVKEYLFGVYKGQIESESHQKFHASATEQNHLRLKARSFGYLEDEEQITEVFDVLKDYYKEVSGCEVNNIDYIIDVWFPEAVVYSLIKKKRLTKSKAWEMFEKPKKISKAEEILEHQLLIRSGSPESNFLKIRLPPKPVKLRPTT